MTHNIGSADHGSRVGPASADHGSGGELATYTVEVALDGEPRWIVELVASSRGAAERRALWSLRARHSSWSLSRFSIVTTAAAVPPSPFRR